MQDELERLHTGVAALDAADPVWRRREDNYRGQQELPYAPEGVSEEYLDLRRQSIANWLSTAMNVPVQRMEMESVTDEDGKVDREAWRYMTSAQMHTRQRILFSSMMVHGRAALSVTKTPAGARMAVENVRRVHFEPSPEDPFTTSFVVKRWTEKKRQVSSLWTPPGSDIGDREFAVVYDESTCARFQKMSVGTLGEWKKVSETPHGLGALPFVQIGSNVDADNVPHAAIDDLIEMQNACNTIRFNTLLAMQFSAFRQRVATGYDPLLRDASGDIVYMVGPDGEPLIGPDGQPVPVLRQGGKVGVDRMLVFPGSDTKVFDLDESNLDRYITVYVRFLTDLFTKGQVPPQYALDKMANLSGDAMAGADATLQALVADLQGEAAGGLDQAMQLMDRALGRQPLNREISWADRAPKSFGQIVDGVVKLVQGAGFPKRDAWDMLQGATPNKVDSWMEHAAEEASDTWQAQLDAAVLGG
ncbi:phage portal protein [Gordonia sp. (in: high G+C Gram-positive bacteria)]|uniref:phage portal protein n=1 Tax=Gordonia sp. (in: high G+C Gram-positive bacteria) TaxID=84139 RepID=UPI003C734956